MSESPASDSRVEQERQRRQQMWNRLLEAGGPENVEPRLLREIGIYGGAQGVWVDKERTGAVHNGNHGVTVGLLHTGSSYADDLSLDGVVYHYPTTNRPPGRDQSEVNATKAAGELRLPVFVITYPSPSSTRRNVHLGWVEGWDDPARLFLISFADNPPQQLIQETDVDQASFTLHDASAERVTSTSLKRNQARFRFEVLHRYGPCCAVCHVTAPELLDAAHIVPKEEKGGDDPRNGLILCANHHRAFDAGLWAIDPESLNVVIAPTTTSNALGIDRQDISHLGKHPHADALQWAWSQWRSREVG